ncbi:MAG: hypothetical protein N2645_02935 [Clostridia bacterium]|nr:hypothetical protein [Clostridia bacterium]
MFEKISIRNILFSFLIGAIIGITNQIILNSPIEIGSVLLSILISGTTGLFIGTIVEFVLVLLPISIAKPSSYFFINNIIALFVTAIVILGLYFYGVLKNMNATDIIIVLIVAFAIIVLANTFDFFRYKKTNMKLMEYKAKRKFK